MKRQTIHGKCKACGNSFTADPKQKLSTFILKNPPPTDSAESENSKSQSIKKSKMLLVNLEVERYLPKISYSFI